MCIFIFYFCILFFFPSSSLFFLRSIEMLDRSRKIVLRQAKCHYFRHPVSPIFQYRMYQNAPEGTYNFLVHWWFSSLKIDTGIEGFSRGESASIFSVHLCRESIRAVPWKIQSVARRMHAYPRNLITRLRLADRTRRVCMTGRCA